MIIGMLPMAFAFGEGGEQNAPLGRAVIGGLIMATLTTLFFVPVVYSYLAKSRRSTRTSSLRNDCVRANSPCSLDEDLWKDAKRVKDPNETNTRRQAPGTMEFRGAGGATLVIGLLALTFVGLFLFGYRHYLRRQSIVVEAAQSEQTSLP